MIDYLKTLYQDWRRFREVRHIRPGMVVTWGASVIACRVVASNATGLVLEYPNGRIDTFRQLPAGLQILPAGTPPGKLKETVQDG